MCLLVCVPPRVRASSCAWLFAWLFWRLVWEGGHLCDAWVGEGDVFEFERRDPLPAGLDQVLAPPNPTSPPPSL
eukprot:2002212-Rhodomonas_salina.1